MLGERPAARDASVVSRLYVNRRVNHGVLNGGLGLGVPPLEPCYFAG